MSNASFKEVDIDLLYHLLKTCGYQLRVDDGDSLREMIAVVQKKAGEAFEGKSKDTEHLQK